MYPFLRLVLLDFPREIRDTIRAGHSRLSELQIQQIIYHIGCIPLLELRTHPVTTSLYDSWICSMPGKETIVTVVGSPHIPPKR